MNILLTTETYLPYITGVSVSTDSIARFMASRGHNVTLICPKPLVKGVVPPQKGLTIIEVPSVPFAVYNLNATAIFPLAFPSLRKIFEKTDFDIVHIQEPGPAGVATLIEARKRQIPVLGALHFIPEQVDRVLWGSFERIVTPILNIYVRFIYNKYDAVMTPSFFFANYLKSTGVKTPVNVISNGTDTKKFHPDKPNVKLREKLGFTKNDFVFFFIGRLDRDKNVETLVRAMPYTNPKIKLLIVGRGTEKGFLKGLAEKLKVSQRIIWVDYITDSEMPDYYHAVDAFSIMSPYEGQSIVTLQAVASGLPVIAAKASALPELVNDGKNGFLVHSYDFISLAKKMNILSKNKEMQAKFGAESRRISLAHNKPKVLGNLELLYRKIISDRQDKYKFRALRGKTS